MNSAEAIRLFYGLCWALQQWTRSESDPIVTDPESWPSFDLLIYQRDRVAMLLQRVGHDPEPIYQWIDSLACSDQNQDFETFWATVEPMLAGLCDVLELEQRVPPIGDDWLTARQAGERNDNMTPAQLAERRPIDRGGRIAPPGGLFGIDADGRIWRKKSKNAWVYYYPDTVTGR